MVTDGSNAITGAFMQPAGCRSISAEVTAQPVPSACLPGSKPPTPKTSGDKRRRKPRGNGPAALGAEGNVESSDTNLPHFKVTSHKLRSGTPPAATKPAAAAPAGGAGRDDEPTVTVVVQPMGARRPKSGKGDTALAPGTRRHKGGKPGLATAALTVARGAGSPRAAPASQYLPQRSVAMRAVTTHYWPAYSYSKLSSCASKGVVRNRALLEGGGLMRGCSIPYGVDEAPPSMTWVGRPSLEGVAVDVKLHFFMPKDAYLVAAGVCKRGTYDDVTLLLLSGSQPHIAKATYERGKLNLITSYPVAGAGPKTASALRELERGSAFEVSVKGTQMERLTEVAWDEDWIKFPDKEGPLVASGCARPYSTVPVERCQGFVYTAAGKTVADMPVMSRIPHRRRPCFGVNGESVVRTSAPVSVYHADLQALMGSREYSNKMQELVRRNETVNAKDLGHKMDVDLGFVPGLEVGGKMLVCGAVETLFVSVDGRGAAVTFEGGAYVVNLVSSLPLSLTPYSYSRGKSAGPIHDMGLVRAQRERRTVKKLCNGCNCGHPAFCMLVGEGAVADLAHAAALAVIAIGARTPVRFNPLTSHLSDLPEIKEPIEALAPDREDMKAEGAVGFTSRTVPLAGGKMRRFMQRCDMVADGTLAGLLRGDAMRLQRVTDTPFRVLAVGDAPKRLGMPAHLLSG